MNEQHSALTSKERSLAQRIATRVVQGVCELPDYNSPDDQPDLLQCTVKELEACVLRAFESCSDETVDESPDITEQLVLLEQLLVEWWGTDMDDAELFNRAVRLSPRLAKAIQDLPERPAPETPVDSKSPQELLQTAKDSLQAAGPFITHNLTQALIETLPERYEAVSAAAQERYDTIAAAAQEASRQLSEAETLLRAWADPLPPNGKLYWEHVNKARQYFKDTDIQSDCRRTGEGNRE